MMLKKCALIAALLLVIGPASARADWLFTPNIGVGFGGNTTSNDKLTYGASIAYMGAGILGFEGDFAWTPNFFEDSNNNVDLFTDADNVSAAMANVIVGIPIGGTHGGGFRPYVATGFGLMRTEIQNDAELFDLKQNDWGWDIGFGAMGFVSQHVGFRGDVRYYRDLESTDVNTDFPLINDAFDNTHFNFWRGTAGVAFRW